MGLLSFWLLLGSVLLQTAELQQKAENCKWLPARARKLALEAPFTANSHLAPRPHWIMA
jgi:hypothetical protein